VEKNTPRLAIKTQLKNRPFLIFFRHSRVQKKRLSETQIKHFAFRAMATRGVGGGGIKGGAGVSPAAASAAPILDF